ncbi:UNVERIFIED_CONTAM: hypothetical protein PYX00_003804 [Menopon gallinae]|uniref:Abasic site processing protein HMCES n=1 Tax=Menopon gallinae TaxID=328185 RepID=A0AAW2I3G4_9NEOP
MCGRTACTLAPENVQKALSYKPKKSSKYVKPEWREASNGGRNYKPSHNVCPTDITPVLISGAHFSCESERIIQPMMWGMIPPWHQGDYKSHKLSTNNCRIENLDSSKLYKKPFLQGQRCVVVCDGFYEWQTTKGKDKQPYFIYMPQVNDIKIEDEKTWSTDFNENEGWKGPNLLKMAALFDRWVSPEGEEIYSYSIITLESNETLSWLHHRMPAILDSDELVSSWLDFGHINGSNALELLKGVKLLTWHKVSTLVNNSRNKDVTCNKPLTEKYSSPMNHQFQ